MLSDNPNLAATRLANTRQATWAVERLACLGIPAHREGTVVRYPIEHCNNQNVIHAIVAASQRFVVVGD